MILLLRQVFLLGLLLGATQTRGTVPYTVRDDVSWAITRADKLSYPYHQKLYDDFMAGCNKASGGDCESGEQVRLRMNLLQPSGVYNYTQVGFEKIRAPPKLFQILMDFYERNKGKETVEWKSINSYHNMWDAPPWFISLENREFGGGDDLQREVWTAARPVLEEWTGMRLSPVSMYGVRIYKNDSILAPHVDRMPLVTSCIINLDQDLDEDWPLEVFDHDGNAHNVSMKPGDMVLYESHSIIHGRPFPMKGREYVNVFLHFEPIGPLDLGIEKSGPQEGGLPQYIIPGGSWEDDYMGSHPFGWEIPENVPWALLRGDVRALEYIAHKKPELLHLTDDNGWKPIHEAVFRGDLDGVQFLMERGATLQDRIDRGDAGLGPNLIELAQQSLVVHDEHPVMQYLLSLSEGVEL